MAPTSSAAVVDVSALQNITHGYASGSNTDVRPTDMGVGDLDPDTSFYVTVTITPQADARMQLEQLTYSYRSYYAGATGQISVLTSLDGFAAPVDTQPWAGGSEAT